MTEYSLIFTQNAPYSQLLNGDFIRKHQIVKLMQGLIEQFPLTWGRFIKKSEREEENAKMHKSPQKCGYLANAMELYFSLLTTARK